MKEAVAAVAGAIKELGIASGAPVLDNHAMTTPTPEHPALTAVRKSGSSKVKVAVSDIDGVLRGKYLHIDKFLGAAEPAPAGGFGFCDVVFGWDVADQTLRQHAAHRLAARLPRRARAPRPGDAAQRAVGRQRAVLPRRVRQTPDHTPSPICPRQTLKRVLARAEKMGFAAMCGHGVRVVQLPRDAADRGPPSAASTPSRSRPACSATRCCA